MEFADYCRICMYRPTPSPKGYVLKSTKHCDECVKKTPEGQEKPMLWVSAIKESKGTFLRSCLPFCEENCIHSDYCNGSTSSGTKNPQLRYEFDDGWLQLYCKSFEIEKVSQPKRTRSELVGDGQRGAERLGEDKGKDAP